MFCQNTFQCASVVVNEERCAKKRLSLDCGCTCLCQIRRLGQELGHLEISRILGLVLGVTNLNSSESGMQTPHLGLYSSWWICHIFCSKKWAVSPTVSLHKAKQSFEAGWKTTSISAALNSDNAPPSLWPSRCLKLILRLTRKALKTVINGHFRNLNWRYLLYGLCKGYVRGYASKIFGFIGFYIFGSWNSHWCESWSDGSLHSESSHRGSQLHPTITQLRSEQQSDISSFWWRFELHRQSAAAFFFAGHVQESCASLRQVETSRREIGKLRGDRLCVLDSQQPRVNLATVFGVMVTPPMQPLAHVRYKCHGLQLINAHNWR